MSSLNVTFVAADRLVWEGEASAVSVMTVDGSLGILPNKSPVLAVLDHGPVAITSQSGQRREIQVSGGFISVDDSIVTVVADDVIESDS